MTGAGAGIVERLFVRRAPLLPPAHVLEGGGIGIDEHLAGRTVDREKRTGGDSVLASRSPATAGMWIDRARMAL